MMTITTMTRSIPILLLMLGTLAIVPPGCKVPVGIRGYKTLSPAERSWADSLLLYGLDHEALYTLLDTLKPVSSLKMYRLALMPDSTHPAHIAPPMRRAATYDSLQLLYHICNAMSTATVQWVAQPYRRADDTLRIVQLYAVRSATLTHTIRRYPAYFGSLGISPATPATTVLSIIESAPTYSRWRGYGYLFGYPPHAVDFFVEAGKTQDSTGQFVKRQFFNMPVYAGESGYFTYALPIDYTPMQTDSVIYEAAAQKLAQYNSQRQKWVTPRELKGKKVLKAVHTFK